MKQYELFELSYHGKKLDDNQAEAPITAEFTDEAGIHSIRGFYAGNGIYKVRFLPRVPGEVKYKVEGLIHAEGSTVCEPADPGHHGPVKPCGSHLKFEDGKWFHSFGTTVYALAHQTDALTAETFKTLADSPFNKVRLCVFPKHYDYNVNDPEHFPFMVKAGQTYTYERGNTFNSVEFLQKKAKIWDVRKPDFAFWDHLEEQISHLERLGIQADLILFHPYDRWGFSCLSQEDNLLYLDYCLRRLAAFPNVWWSLANEYDLCKGKTLEDWKEIEKFVAKKDPYHHMLSVHNCFAGYDFSRKNITHCSLQKRTMNLVPEYVRKYGKPVLYDECVYEGNLKQTWGSLSGQEMNNRFWKVTVTGGYCTHGEVFLDMDMKNVDDAVLWWAKGGKLSGTSPKRIAFLKNIIEEIGEPLEGMEGWLDQMLRENLENKKCPGDDSVMRELHKMDPLELCRQADAEFMYAGHAGDNAFLYYYGTDCCARVDIDLPEGNTYRIDVIDAWNMTRKTVMTGASGKVEVKLTGHEYMAVLALKEGDWV